MHVYGNDGNTKLSIVESSTDKTLRTLLYLENNGNPQIEMNNTGKSSLWTMSAGDTYNINNNGGNKLFQLKPDGDLIILKSDGVTEVSLRTIISKVEELCSCTL